MNIPHALACCFLFTASAAIAAEPLAVKLGAWEMSYVTQTSGDSLPQAMLDKLTPEQRARHEERMKKRAEAGPRKRTETTCVKKENLERDAFSKENQKDCRYTYTSQTRNLYAATYACTGELARKGEIRYEVLGGDKIKGMMKMSSARGTMEMQMEGRWLGATCAKDND